MVLLFAFIALALVLLTLFYLQGQKPAEQKEECLEGEFSRSAWDCWEIDDEWKNCNKETSDKGCCKNEDDCWWDGECYTAEDALSKWPEFLCFKGKWDYCFEKDLCETRGEYYCDGAKWIKGTMKECLEKPPPEQQPGRGPCPEGQFYMGEWDCWEDDDDEKCNVGEYSHGCCFSANDCWFNNLCYSSNAPLAEGSDFLCFEGKWDKCKVGEECEQRGNYYCHNEKWQQEKPEGCET